MKRVLKLSLALAIVCMIMVGNVYGLSLNADLQSSKTQVEKGEQFILNFSVSNIESVRGIISLTATLEYDKDSLELVKIEGQNGWDTPVEGVSFNEGNIAINRNGLGNSNEVILKMTFKAKENPAKETANVSLRKVVIADGDGTARFDSVKKDITIKGNNQQTVIDQGQNSNGNNNTNNNSNTGTNGSTGINQENNLTEDKTVANNKALPKTGNPSYVWIGIIATIAVLLAIYFFVKIRKCK